MSKEWATPVISYFRSNPNELGEARIMGFIPDTYDMVAHSAPIDLVDENTRYAYSLLSTQTIFLKKLAEEFLGE
jgi:hypothetical protein